MNKIIIENNSKVSMSLVFRSIWSVVDSECRKESDHKDYVTDMDNGYLIRLKKNNKSWKIEVWDK